MTDTSQTTGCRHEWQCDGWTIDPRTSRCRICRKRFVYWSRHDNQTSWDIGDEDE